MSVVGIDFGNKSSVVAIAKERGTHILLDDLSNRETPAVVCFGEKQRFIGLKGELESRMQNPKNTISQIKRFIGRKFSDPELQRDLKELPFVATEGPDGYPLIHAEYLGETKKFTPTQILAMLFLDLKSIVDKNINIPVEEGTINLRTRYGDRCCIGIPAYFTEIQRRAVIDSAKIAGLRPVCLFHETTAIALFYGIYKKNLSAHDQLNVAFVDIGHASMQVCIVGFREGQLNMLAYAYDRSLGGRDFDEVLFHHFHEKFKREYNIDVYKNTKSSRRLRAACEEVKKALSEKPEAVLEIECLIDKKDVKDFIKREEFEKISASILERVRKPLETALLESGLKVENIHSVEVVGSGSRVPAIIKILTQFFGKVPLRSMDACESVARGCALQCAIMNPFYKAKEFKVNESFPFHVTFSWKDSGPENEAENQHTADVFPKGSPIPSLKELTFNKSETFAIDVRYTHISEKISTYTIGPIQKTRSPNTTLKVEVCLNVHGIVSVNSATLWEDAGVEVPVYKETKKIDTGKASVAKAEAPKEKVKKWKVPVSETIYDALNPTDLEKLIEKESEMAKQDQLMVETGYEKYALEACVYDMKDKLDDIYKDLVTDLERDAISRKLDKVENWLLNEGNDETKDVYVAKHEELKKLGNPIEERYKAYTDRNSESGD